MNQLQQMREFQQKSEECELLIETAPVGFVVTKADEAFTLLYQSPGTYELMGYTPEEHYALFGLGGLSTLHPDDAQSAARSAREQMEEKGSFRVKARLSHKEKEYIWVDFSGKLRLVENCARIYIVIVDITDHIALLEMLQNEQELMKTAFELTDDALFDYDIQKRSIRYSNNFARRFGICDYYENFPETMIAQTNAILPEDAEGFRKMVEDANRGVYSENSEELRFREPNGTIVYFLHRYRILFDQVGEPVRVIGKMTDITRYKEEVDMLMQKSEKDPLTGLYNKGTTESLIKEILKMRRFHDTHHALMIIDADNFKEINDKLGHLQGDIVLKNLAERLQALFRSDDVVGRIGGDEFFVFAKNYKSTNILEKKAGEICRLFHETYQINGIAVEASVSVGIALCPQDATDFETLYQCADKALYAIKARGKDNYCFYESIGADSE